MIIRKAVVNLKEMLEFLTIIISILPIIASNDLKQINSNFTDFNQILLYKNYSAQYLLVASKNMILKIPLENGNNKIEQRSLGPVMDSDVCQSENRCVFDLCTQEMKSANKCQKFKRDVYVKTWTLTDNNELLVCLNIFMGTCQTIDLHYFGGNVKGYSNVITTTYLRSHSTMLYANKRVYIGIEIAKANNLFNSDFNALTIRKLPNFDIDGMEESKKFYISYGKLGYGPKTIYPLEFKGSFYYRAKSNNLEFVFFIVDLPKYPKTSQSQIPIKFKTNLIRICEGDGRFESFMEFPLNCAGREDDYERLDSWSFSKVNKNLSDYYRKTTKFSQLRNSNDSDFENLLFLNYHTSTDNSLSSESIFTCAYPMAEILEIYTTIRHRCNQGRGFVNFKPFNQFGSEQSCRSVKGNERDCVYNKDSNKFIKSTMLIDDVIPNNRKMVMTDKRLKTRATVIRIVRVYNEYTVAIIGGKDGHLYTFDLLENKAALIESRPLFKESIKDIKIWKNRTAFVTSKSKIISTLVTNCKSLDTCTQCIHSSPFCGWCVTMGKCVTQEKCVAGISSRNSYYRGNENWIRFERNNAVVKCPTIGKLKEKSVSEISTIYNIIQFSITKINPSFIRGIECVFKTVGDNFVIHRSQGSPIGTNNSVQCSAPNKDIISKLSFTKDYIRMKLELTMNNIHLTETSYFIHDCSKNSDCYNCSDSRFKCVWCTYNRQCTHYKSATCNSALKLGYKQMSQCPVFKLTQKTYSVKSEIKTRARIISLNQNPRDVQFFCKENCSGKAVSGNLVDGYAECNFGKIAVAGSQTKFCKLQIIWQVYGYNSSVDLSVELYDCRSLAQRCDDCVLLANQYDCGYYTVTNQCVSRQEAGIIKYWINSVSQNCPNPVITEIIPANSTFISETILTVKGYNFAFNQPQIMNALSMENTNIRLELEFVSRGFVRAKQFQCRVKKPPNFIDTPIQFRLKYTPGIYKTFKPFWFYSPVVEKLIPAYGPLVGGSEVELVGKYLNIGSERKIYFNRGSTVINCTIVRSSKNSVLFRIGDFKPSQQFLKRYKRQINNNQASLSLEIDNYKQSFPNIKYRFYENPRDFKVYKKQFFYRGYQTTGIDSYNMGILYSPCVTIECPHMTSRCKKCKRVNNNGTICEIPKVSSRDTSSKCLFKIGIGSGYRYLYHTNVQFYPLPKFKYAHIKSKLPSKSFSFLLNSKSQTPNYQTQPSITIILTFENSRVPHNSVYQPTADDFTITIGQRHVAKKRCMLEILGDTRQLQCRLVAPFLKIGEMYDVNLQLGENEVKTISTVEFVQGEISLDMATICIVVFLVLVILFLVVVVAVVVVRKGKKAQEQRQNALETNEQRKERKNNEHMNKELQQLNKLDNHYIDPTRIHEAPKNDFNHYILYSLFPNTHPKHTIHRPNLSIFDGHGFMYDRNKPLTHPLLYRDQIHVIESTQEYSRKLLCLFVQEPFVVTFFNFVEESSFQFDQTKSEIISLLSVILMKNMKTYTKALKTLIRNEYQRRMERQDEGSLLRQSNSVSKFMSNWLKILMYKELNDSIGDKLINLYCGVSDMINDGPINPDNNKSYYALNDQKLYNSDFNNINVTVKYTSEFNSEKIITVPLIDIDTYSQASFKIRSQIFWNQPYSKWKQEEFEIRKEDQSDEESMLQFDPNKTLKDYNIVNDSVLLCQQVTSFSEARSNPSYYNTPTASATNTYRTSQNTISNVQNFNFENSLVPNGSRGSFKKTIGNSCCFTMRERQKKLKARKLQRQNQISEKTHQTMKINSLVMKNKLKPFIKLLFDSILSIDSYFIKDLFAFFDSIDAATEVKADMKINSLILRFWVDIIANIDFLFDIPSYPALSDCLICISKVLLEIFHAEKSKEQWSNILFGDIIDLYKEKAKEYIEKEETVQECQSQYEIPNTSGINISLGIVILYNKFLHQNHDKFKEYINETNICSQGVKNEWIDKLEEVFDLYSPNTFIMNN